MIYVPSKRRSQLVVKNLPSWLSTGLPVRIVVEEDDAEEYRAVTKDARRSNDVKVLTLPQSGRGVSYARNNIIKHASKHDRKYIVMADDDCWMSPGVDGMMAAAKDIKRFSGIGGYQSIYGHFLKMPPNTGVHKLHGGMGHQVVVYRTASVLKVGGYDERIKTHDDTDLRIRLQLQGQGDWYVDSGALVKVGKRYTDGGVQASVGDWWEEQVQADCKLMQEKYGEKMVSTFRMKDGRLTLKHNWRELYKQLEAK